MDNTMPHIPVLLNEVIDILDLKENDVVIDGTMGYGGHSAEILKHIPNGQLIGIDQDPVAIKYCTEKFKAHSNVSIHHHNFSDFPKALDECKIVKADKILVDLGMSSYQLDSGERGFSFQAEDDLLDMRMNDSSGQATASDILAQYTSDELERVFRDYGEIRHPEKFVSNIVNARQSQDIKKTSDLIPIIKKSFFFRNKRRLYIKTLSQVFQALRIEVNEELSHLDTFLHRCLDYLKPGGRLAVISFHSLEDRMVKQFIKAHKGQFQRLNKKVIIASNDEVKANIRSKPAKLRGAEKCLS